ncbi:MAG: carboxypeptidase-like regulatory domain-containing protein [Pseudomonadota bacterium]
MRYLTQLESPLRCALGIILTSVLLAGCGGSSGGGSNNNTNSGGTTPPPPMVSEQDLTISGVVTDEPIAGAEVTVRIGDEVFTTTADATGAYEILITLIDGEYDPDTLVEITARGVGTQENVELIAIVASVGELIALAGEDETLSSADNPRLNVTHVSTARFLLAIDANGGTPPADLAALAAAEIATDVDELIELAALIKLIVDDDLIPVPEGETTASLLRGGDGEQTVRSVIIALLTEAGLLDEDGEPTDEFEDALEAAIAATIADPSVRGEFDPTSLVGLSVWTAATVPAWVPGVGDVVDVAEDGTGTVYDVEFSDPAFDPENLDDFAIPFTWTIDDGVISVVYEDNSSTNFPFFSEQNASILIDEYGFSQDVVDFLLANINQLPAGQIQVDETEIGEEITVIAAAGDRLQVWIASSLEYRIDATLLALGWEDELPVGAVTEFSSSQVQLNAENQDSGVDAPETGDTWAVPLGYAVEDARLTEPLDMQLQHNVYTLLEGGTTSAGELGGDPLQWSVTDGVLTLESGGTAWTYRPLATNGDVIFALISLAVDGEVLLRTAAWIAEDDGSGATFADDLVQDIPLFWNVGINQQPVAFYLPDGRLDPDFVFGYDFAEGGTMGRLNPFSNPGTCFGGTSDECFVTEGRIWMWSTPNDNLISLEVGPPESILTRNRFWRVLRYMPGGRAVVVEYSLSQFDGEPWTSFIPARINTLELTDLTTWPEYYDEAQFPGGEP